MSAAAQIPVTTRNLPCLVLLAAGTAALLLVFLPECRAAVRVWSESTAYGHCYLVAPIAAYLAWDRRDSLRGLVPSPDIRFAVLGLPLALTWFVAERLGIMEGRQLAALAFVELLALTVLGWTLFRALLAPFLYLVFLVPFGAFLTPALQSFTARFIDVGLGVLAIPHFVSDMLVEVPAGTFFVAEACAGLRFLIASVAFGVFYAMLNYRSPVRRAGFIAASIVVPIVANGMRALGIVLLGQILGSAEAAAADHIIYGWVFFSFVMLLLVAGGLPFREAPAAARPAPSGPTPLPAPTLPPMLHWAGAAVLLLALCGTGAARALDRQAAAPRLAAAPVVTMPDGCEASTPALAAASVVFTIVCKDGQWLATVQLLPARSTASAVNEARARLIGDIDPEESVTETLQGLPPGAGVWRAVSSRTPGQVTGYATWVRGAPATGGLSQRLAQAIDSLRGTPTPPAVMVLTRRMADKQSDAVLKAGVAELTRIVAAQPQLGAEVARLSQE